MLPTILSVIEPMMPKIVIGTALCLAPIAIGAHLFIAGRIRQPELTLWIGLGILVGYLVPTVLF